MLTKRSVRQYIRERLSLGRYLHSLRTAKMIGDIIVRLSSTADGRPEAREDLYGIEISEIGELAGLAHDMARELPPEGIRNIAEADLFPLLPEEVHNPILLHGRAAAVLMKTEWGVVDEPLLQAVRWHTTGDVGMGRLGMLLFLADYIEPGREHIDEDFRKRVLDKGKLTDMMMLVLEDQGEHNKKLGRKISKRTERLITALREDRCAVVQAG